MKKKFTKHRITIFASFFAILLTSQSMAQIPLITSSYEYVTDSKRWSNSTEIEFSNNPMTISEAQFANLSAYSNMPHFSILEEYLGTVTEPTLSIKDKIEIETFTLYPNPVSRGGNITVSSSIRNIAQVIIFSTRGFYGYPRVVSIYRNINAKEYEIDVSHLFPGGAYFVRLELENGFHKYLRLTVS